MKILSDNYSKWIEPDMCREHYYMNYLLFFCLDYFKKEADWISPLLREHEEKYGKLLSHPQQIFDHYKDYDLARYYIEMEHGLPAAKPMEVEETKQEEVSSSSTTEKIDYKIPPKLPKFEPEEKEMAKLYYIEKAKTPKQVVNDYPWHLIDRKKASNL